MKKTEEIIEAVLFALGRNITYSELSNTLKEDESKIKEAIDKLELKYNENTAIQLVRVKNSVELVTNKKYYDEVALFVENTKRQTLSQAALETLTIIAYNPKITKSDIEKIRGVNSDFAVGRLLECGLIEEVARLNLPGRPAVYAVTNEFLKSTGINNVEDLPEYNSIKINDEQIMMGDLKED